MPHSNEKITYNRYINVKIKARGNVPRMLLLHLGLRFIVLAKCRHIDALCVKRYTDYDCEKSFRVSETWRPPLAHHYTRCIWGRDPISCRRRRALAEYTPRRASPVTPTEIFRVCAVGRASGDLPPVCAYLAKYKAPLEPHGEKGKRGGDKKYYIKRNCKPRKAGID